MIMGEIDHVQADALYRVFWTSLTTNRSSSMAGTDFDGQLSGTQVTDAGLEHLKGLINLVYLELSGTQVTDAGLVHLKGLSKLNFLYLGRTQVTDAGVKDLQEALPNCMINH